MIQGWKILTPELRPPIQGGEPIFDGTFPFLLPRVDCDAGPNECSFGWNFTEQLETGFQIAGFWSKGEPNVAVLIETDEAIQRGNKCRSPQLNLLRFATSDEIRESIHRFSKIFGEHQGAMAEEQWQWFLALGRPQRDRSAVQMGLKSALKVRKLDWSLKEFPSSSAARAARAAWAAWAAWDAWEAWAAWAARAAWAAWDAWEAWAARETWDAWEAWAARETWAAWEAWEAWAAREAWAAWAALNVSFAARSGWISHQYDLLTVGIRDAYRNGLAIALPTGKNELGWAMEP